MKQTCSFRSVTLLVTVYNRSSSLERLLESFKNLDCHFEDIVVSDDGSRPEHIEKIEALHAKYTFRLVTAPKNKGLGNNLNKGQDAITTPYTLYVQEDFVPKEAFPSRLQQALQYMNESSRYDLVRFYAYFKYPHLKHLKNGLSEMKFERLSPGYKKYYMYSDHPHLRRSSFLQKFGRYAEGLNPEQTEYRMMMSFLQKKGAALYYDDFKGNFDQVNSSAEPSTLKRTHWRESENVFVSSLRHLYRHVKFRYDFFFMS